MNMETPRWPQVHRDNAAPIEPGNFGRSFDLCIIAARVPPDYRPRHRKTCASRGVRAASCAAGCGITVMRGWWSRGRAALAPPPPVPARGPDLR